jgi:ketosteroid isomerase-like protein
MKADSKTEAEVVKVLNQAHDAYARRDMNGLLSAFVPDADALMFGTGVDERRVGSEQIKTQAERDWAQSDESVFSWNWHLVSMAGSAAVVSAEGEVQAKVGGQEINLPIRFTGALEKRGDKWLFVHAHYSAPLSGEAAGESFPTE